jgi:hypothetical protein
MLIIPMGPSVMESGERIAWFEANLGVYLFAWGNQIILVCCFIPMMIGVGLRVFERNPVSAIMGGMAGLIATVVFLIEKFVRFWAIPLMTRTLTHAPGGEKAALAEINFQIWDGSAMFTFVDTMDYLGFWLYAIFGLFLFYPLWKIKGAARIAGVMFLVYGVGYHVLLFGTLLGSATGPPLMHHIDNLLMSWGVATIFLAIDFYKRKSAAEA